MSQNTMRCTSRAAWTVCARFVCARAHLNPATVSIPEYYEYSSTVITRIVQYNHVCIPRILLSIPVLEYPGMHKKPSL